MNVPRYKRVLVKLSGEVFAGGQEFGWLSSMVSYLACELADIHAVGCEVAVVVGGGNVMRGAVAARAGVDRVTADGIGMLATIQNGLALQDALEKMNIDTRLQTAVEVEAVAEPFIRRRAIRHLEKGRVVILAGGIGIPYLTTDTAAAMRALEIKAEAVLKATNVDGVYDKDPNRFHDAVRYEALDYDTCIAKHLGVMDRTAFALCADNSLPIVVFKIVEQGLLRRAVLGERVGTYVGPNRD